MDRERRRRAKRDVVSLCNSGLGAEALLREATHRIGDMAPYDSAGWHMVDPSTLLFTSSYRENLAPEPRLPIYEYDIPDVNKWTYLARRTRPTGVLSQATHGRPETSPRFRDLLKPYGLAHELRVSFVSGGMCWAFLGLYRERGRPDFTEDEAAFAAEIDRHIADGLRRALLLDAVTAAAPVTEGPGVILLDAAGDVIGMNAAGQELTRLLPEDSGKGVPHTVLAVAIQARRAASGEEAARAWSRTRMVTGQWVVLHGTQLRDGAEATTAVVLESARPAELVELIVLVYGLTPREREVTRQVILGRSTAEMAHALYLSPFTVQDHLKAIFEKVGVRSRRELVATVFRDNQWPRLPADAPAGADGRSSPPVSAEKEP